MHSFSNRLLGNAANCVLLVNPFDHPQFCADLPQNLTRKVRPELGPGLVLIDAITHD